MPSVVLLGDSILDNGPYTRPEPDTTAHLKRVLGPAWDVSRLAMDGSTIADLPRQLAQVKGRPDYIVLSVGGNDVTAHLGILEGEIREALPLLERLLTIADDFAGRYDAVLRKVVDRANHVIALTIYEPPLDPPPIARLARVPLAILNDRIIRLGAASGLTVLDLRGVCTVPEDFVKEIEPSPQGATKIAQALARLLTAGPMPPFGRVVAA